MTQTIAKVVAGETCIILDEIQDCPEARTSLKFFKEDGEVLQQDAESEKEEVGGT